MYPQNKNEEQDSRFQKENALTFFKVEIIGSFGRPQPHSVDSIVLVSWNRSVIRHGKHYLEKEEMHQMKIRRKSGL